MSFNGEGGRGDADSQRREAAAVGGSADGSVVLVVVDFR